LCAKYRHCHACGKDRPGGGTECIRHIGHARDSLVAPATLECKGLMVPSDVG
jgi:hypothetical protein